MEEPKFIKKFNIKEEIQEFSKHQIEVYSACAAFWLFISLIPFLIGMLAILPYTPLQASSIETIIKTIMPKQMETFALCILSDIFNKTPSLISVSFILALIMAAMGIVGITKGLNSIEEIDDTRNFIVLRIRAIVYTACTMVVIVFLLVFGVYGKKIANLMFDIRGFIPDFIQTLGYFENILIIVPLFILFLFFYYALPAKKILLVDCIWGAIFTSICWWGMTIAFSIYLQYSDRFSIYGSLAQVVALMLYFNVGIYLLFVGAEINKYIRNNIKPLKKPE